MALRNVAAPAVAGILLVVALWCWRLWQPQRQVELHQRHFLDAIGDRRYAALSSFLAADFRDGAGHDKAWVLERAREVLPHFFALSVRESGMRVEFATSAERATATVRTRLRLQGAGDALAEMAKDAVNTHPEPFRFTWRKAGWQPWKWELSAAEHPLFKQADGDF